MRRLCFFMIAVCAGLFATAAHAQSGLIGFGLRLTPDGGGATGKVFLDRNIALEAQLNAGGILALSGKSLTATGLVEYHVSLPQPAWRIFFGGGAHLGSWDREDYRGTQFIFGVDGIGGVEYVFKNLPLGLSADFKPAINFVTDVDFFPHGIFGVAGRLYLARMVAPTPK